VLGMYSVVSVTPGDVVARWGAASLDDCEGGIYSDGWHRHGKWIVI